MPLKVETPKVETPKPKKFDIKDLNLAYFRGYQESVNLFFAALVFAVLLVWLGEKISWD